jgi:hypothetical protein
MGNGNSASHERGYFRAIDKIGIFCAFSLSCIQASAVEINSKGHIVS